MGAVWKASDHTLGRHVAIKVLPTGFANDGVRLRRFEREAKLLAALNHANVAAVYSLHESAGVRFLAMEYVPGDDLAERLARGPLALDTTLVVAKQIAEALEEAHEKGIVHRDLKPANVKLTPDGKVKVLDFGLAKALAGDGDGVGLAREHTGAPRAVPDTHAGTLAGVILGTAAYMPPEQARGLPVDKRADIWAFGVLLFEMIAGRRPFAGATLTDVLAAVVTAEPDWNLLPPATPPSLVRLIKRCLEKETRRRLRDIGDARLEIDELLSVRDSADPRASVDSRTGFGRVRTPAGRWARRPWIFGSGALAGAAAAVLAVAAALTGGGSSPQPLVVQRFNIGLAPGTVLEDILDSQRQSLAISRDGSTLAYVGRSPGERHQIYVRHLGTLLPRPVRAAAGGEMPFLSPDGKHLGFFADGKLKIVALEGGAPRVLCDAPAPRGASWGDDGTIVFAPEVRGGLWRIAVTGGVPEPVTMVGDEPENDGHRWPLLLPGGRGVLFNAERRVGESRRSIDLLRLDTGERRTLVRDGSHARYVEGHLLFGQAGSLMAAPFDLARLELTGPAVAVVDDVRMELRATGQVFADASTAGALVYVPGYPRPGERTLVWLDRQGAMTPVTPERRPFRGARLSLDGEHLAVTIADASATSLWSFDLRRSSWTRLSFSGVVDTPVWAPGGDRILFSMTDTDRAGIFSVTADGSSPPLRLTDPSTSLIDMPTVAPDGRSALVAVQSARGDDIYTLSLEGRPALQPFIATAALEVGPVISPSGRFLAYTSNESGRFEVYLRPLRGSGRKWAVSTNGGTTPRWRRDERELFYLEGRRMLSVPLDPSAGALIGPPRVLFEESALAWSDADLARYDVTANGQRFVTVKPEAWEEAPLEMVVVPDFVNALRTRSLPR